MIPLIQEVVIEKYAWLTESEFLNFIGVCESTPGPVAINMATYVGFTQGGVFGSVCAVIGVVLPSFIVILLIAIVLKNLTNNKHFKNFIKGVTPVIVGLLISTGIVMLFKALGYVSINEFVLDVKAIIIFLLLVIVYFLYEKLFDKKMSAVLIIVFSALFGILINVL